MKDEYFETVKTIYMDKLTIVNQIKELIKYSDRYTCDADNHKFSFVNFSFFSKNENKKLRFICTWLIDRDLYDEYFRKG